MDAPEWARLERQLLDAQHACHRRVLPQILRQPRLRAVRPALGSRRRSRRCFREHGGLARTARAGRRATRVLRLYMQGLDGMLRQYTGSQNNAGSRGPQWDVLQGIQHTVRLDAPRRSAAGVQSDGPLGTAPTAKYRARARRYAAMYMGEDPEAPNYDPQAASSFAASSTAAAARCCARPHHSTGSAIRSTSRTSPQDTASATSTRCLRTTQEYGDVAGDSFLNLVATTLPFDAYLATGEAKYRKWIVDYMDAWLERMKREQRHHPQLCRSRRQNRRTRWQVVGQRLRLGIQPGESCDRPSRGSQSHPPCARRDSTTRCGSRAIRSTSMRGAR